MTQQRGKSGGEQPHWTALSDVLPWAGTTPVILAARRSEDCEERTVIALSEADARGLYAEGRLHGWRPA